ncbi:MAG: helix-turn-helix domain-containing protein [Deltaproteobacteria bacterium]|nr:helix-turn-helix domain-containing protein [Deltaproteobacteria bacterium]
MNKRPITRKVKNWTKEQIQEALDESPVNQAAIARELNISATTVSDTVRGRTNSQRVHKAIAEAVKHDVKEIWPEIYLYGEPRRGRRMVVWHRKAAA